MSALAEKRELTEAPVAPEKLAHIVLRVNNFEEAIDWFCRVLNAQVMFKNEMLCFMTYDEEHHRVALLNTPNLPEGGSSTTGLEHVAFTYKSLGDLLSTYERLKKDGINPVWTINHGPTTSIYYAAPGGAQVELQVDNFDTLDDLLNWFAGGTFKHEPKSAEFEASTFARNPIGVEFDADELVRLYREGMPDKELKTQGTAAKH